ncbi:MAG: hypothetical protein AAF636_15055 [Pseudomonadota bacterium]
MTNRIAVTLGALILGIAVLDVIIFGLDHMIFLGKKLLDLIEWMAFWR